ncbi:hypothetical protein LEP1GSC072_1542 [Leptospira noguchii str. Bonito]|nr:hypothetical protein LEP1GSC072_1542 [Leptospira noguchii str. Bonito]
MEQTETLFVLIFFEIVELLPDFDSESIGFFLREPLKTYQKEAPTIEVNVKIVV